jgi:hypothetical protein
MDHEPSAIKTAAFSDSGLPIAPAGCCRLFLS